MKKYLAAYLRLSSEDVDVGNHLKDESNSIQIQRLLIQEYIAKNKELSELQTIEFVDDGYTGTNFERPQFQEMLSLIRTGNIVCIIVKDISRFGRNYLEVGDYLERLFPLLNVRFIAINDHYDSSCYSGTTGGIDVAFRSLVYGQYSQDLSEKIKSSMHLKMASGKYITHCPYGYKKKTGEKHMMEPDPETAPIVREIFLSVIDGKKTTEIAAELNEKNILTPGEYKKVAKHAHSEAMWSHQAVLRIIKDYKYTGAMVNFKCESETIRAKVQRKKPRSEWVVVENSHEAIVTHEEYQEANERIRKVNYVKPIQKDQRDRVYYCAYCGRKLQKSFGLDTYFYCPTKLYRRGSDCEKIRWPKTEIEEVILTAYKTQLMLMKEKYVEIKKKSTKNPILECREKQGALEMKLESYGMENLKLYEQYKEGQFDQEVFLKRKEKLLCEKEGIRKRLLDLQSEEQQLMKSEKVKRDDLNQIKKAINMIQLPDEELRKRMYEDINKVIVYVGKEIEIQWKMGKEMICPIISQGVGMKSNRGSDAKMKKS